MSTFRTFVKLVASIEDMAILEDFLVSITTEKERKALTQRVEIVKLLLEGKPQAKIAEQLGVGIATVTRGSKELNDGRFRYLRNQHEHVQ
jgi:TrpR family trp operon transcriptional repressor